MIRTADGSGQYKRLVRNGDRYPSTLGFQRKKATYTATGGEVSINLALLSPAISYMPGQNMLTVKRSSGGGALMSSDFQELTSTSIGFSGDPLVANEVVEIIQEATVTGVMACTASPQCYTQTATVGQTLVTCDFSWTYGLNSAKAIGGVAVYLQGVLQVRGVDYTETNLGTANTNQIIFVDALLGGENIVVLPAYQPIDTSAAANTFNGQQLLAQQAFYPRTITSIAISTSLQFDTFYSCTASGPTTQTLPAATGSNRTVTIENVGTGSITVSRAGSDLINGLTTKVLAQYASVRLRDYGAGTWIIMS